MANLKGYRARERANEMKWRGPRLKQLRKQRYESFIFQRLRQVLFKDPARWYGGEFKIIGNAQPFYWWGLKTFTGDSHIIKEVITKGRYLGTISNVVYYSIYGIPIDLSTVSSTVKYSIRSIISSAYIVIGLKKGTVVYWKRIGSIHPTSGATIT